MWATVRTVAPLVSGTIFGYSAPKIDREAIDLLKEGWGDVGERAYDQSEIISRPGADEDTLRAVWEPFINTHHYEVHDSFYDSYIGTHPRRTGETWYNQFLMARFFEGSPAPPRVKTVRSLVDWFRPLLDAEDRAAEAATTSST